MPATQSSVLFPLWREQTCSKIALGRNFLHQLLSRWLGPVVLLYDAHEWMSNRVGRGTFNIPSFDIFPPTDMDDNTNVACLQRFIAPVTEAPTWQSFFSLAVVSMDCTQHSGICYLAKMYTYLLNVYIFIDEWICIVRVWVVQYFCDRRFVIVTINP